MEKEVKSETPIGERKEIVGTNFMVFNMPSESFVEFKEYCKNNKMTFELAIRSMLEKESLLTVLGVISQDVCDLRHRVNQLESQDEPSKIPKSLGRQQPEVIEDAGKTK